LLNFIYVIVTILPVLLSVAFVTIAERKTMASMQRRLGPNIVGFYGLLQPFADALKLLIKEYITPTQANTILFFFRTDNYFDFFSIWIRYGTIRAGYSYF